VQPSGGVASCARSLYKHSSEEHRERLSARADANIRRSRSPHIAPKAQRRRRIVPIIKCKLLYDTGAIGRASAVAAILSAAMQTDSRRNRGRR